MRLEPKVARWAVPLLQPCRYKGAKGGRSGGKSHQFCELAAERMASRPGYKVAGIREIQKSIKYSLKSLLEKKIYELGASYLFDMQDQEIKRHGSDGVAIFLGMQDHTADSVKGLEDFDLGLVDEANALSDYSMKLLTPTFRKDGSEVWFAWNPDDEQDAVDTFFRENEGHPDFLLIHVNITDNPFAGETALSEYRRERDKALREKKRDPNVWDRFRHVWLGEYNVISDKFVFRNWRTDEIDDLVPENVIWFYGADWGFANDPAAGVRFCFPDAGTLYIRNEVYELGLPMESHPAFLAGLPNSRKWPLRADNARPEIIDYVRRHGFPKIRSAKKGKGSVEDGVSFIQSFDVVIHPECPNTKREFERYSYKVDPRTGEILPVIVDADNHAIDALRYGCEGLHRKGKLIEAISEETKTRHGADYGVDDDEEEATSWKTL